MGLSALTLYTMTLAPSVGPIDSGELTLAASSLGIPHPPGFPLYVLVSHLISRVPISSIAARVNFASAVFAAIATAGVFRLTLLVLSDDRSPRVHTKAPRRQGVERSIEPRAAIAGAATAALLFMSLRTTWAFATVAEVYTLAACLTVLLWLLMLRPSLARMRVAAVVFGLAMGTHPPMVLAMLPAFAILAARAHGVRFFATTRFLGLFALATIGVAIYLYLPAAALQLPFLNWGDPRTPAHFWAHVSGVQYRGAAQITFDGFGEAIRNFGRVLSQQIGGQSLPIALLLLGVGTVHALRLHGTVFAALGLWMITNVLLTTWMNAAWAGEHAADVNTGDLDAYYFPTYIAGAILAGIGAAAVLNAAAHGTARRGVRVFVAGAATAAAVLQLLIVNWRMNDRRGDMVPRNYVHDVLQSIAPGGMLLMRDWNLSSPLMYVQHAEGDRPDVVALDLNLMERRWYVESVSRRYPAVFSPAANELSVFLNLVSRWDDDPLAVNRDAAYRVALTRAFDNLLNRLIALHLRRAPVYATLEVATAAEGKGDNLAEKLRPQIQFVPQGLVFKFEPGTQFHAPAPLMLRLPELLDVVHRRGAHDLPSQRIASVYRDMLISRGWYLEANGRCGEALGTFEQALAIDSTSATAHAASARCRGAVVPPETTSNEAR